MNMNDIWSRAIGKKRVKRAEAEKKKTRIKSLIKEDRSPEGVN